MNELVSIIVPIYNMEKYLDRCVHYANYISYIDEPLYHYNYERYDGESRKVMTDAIELNTKYADEMTFFYLTHYFDDTILSTLYKKSFAGYL